MNLIGTALRNGGTCEDFFWDILAHEQDSDYVGRLGPGWLHRARERIADDPAEADISDMAAQAGVHRVHFSRSFQRAFGIAPSLYRQRCMAARVLSNVLAGNPLADAASAAGFADQSHMTRTLRKQTGLNPHRLRTLLL
ncbi:helix-turn-helix transcriptional regulator [Allosphingosinicella flava]|uniref:Helix-turn-helix transcriptional regulator n=2 Tax=Allosphingosinicella flava TaxID=2771430 RepID=A0A7T2GJC5_9SPHN|nr:helix-turn-helix transcriptional regulator [Sphingosinicella flava]